MTSTVRRLAPALCALSLWIGCARTAPPPRPAAAAGPPAGATAAARATRRALHTRGMAAYHGKDYATCASALEQAHDLYGAACCDAQAGALDAAFALLAQAIDLGLRDLDLENDSDLVPLHADPRWQRELGHFAAKTAEHRRSLNAELTQLYDDDQADRAMPYERIDWTQVTPRDQARRTRVDEIVAAGGATAADDYYHAAMVYQHGNSTDEIQRAHDLAVRAVQLDPSHDAAKWLAAAAEDRKLMYEHKPQKWGTQYKKIDGAWIVWPVDPAITDEQRDAWNVQPLADAEAHARQMNTPR